MKTFLKILMPVSILTAVFLFMGMDSIAEDIESKKPFIKKVQGDGSRVQHGERREEVRERGSERREEVRERGRERSGEVRERNEDFREHRGERQDEEALRRHKERGDKARERF